jgi:hypothetical protein
MMKPDAKDIEVVDVDEEDAEDEGATVVDDEAAAADEPPSSSGARVVEIEDRSGAVDGSDLWAKVDTDADGLADDEARLERTSTGTYHGDIDRDGVGEDVAKDLDGDGRIETVDTAGEGRSSDVVGAESIAEPESGHIVDHVQGEDDAEAETDDASDGFSAADDDGGTAGGAGGAADDDGGSSGTSTSDDSGSSSSGADDPD